MAPTTPDHHGTDEGRQDETDQAGRLGLEAAGEGVGPVVELGDRRFDAGAGLVADETGAVEHGRDRRLGDPGGASNVAAGDRALRHRNPRPKLAGTYSCTYSRVTIGPPSRVVKSNADTSLSRPAYSGGGTRPGVGEGKGPPVPTMSPHHRRGRRHSPRVVASSSFLPFPSLSFARRQRCGERSGFKPRADAGTTPTCWNAVRDDPPLANVKQSDFIRSSSVIRQRQRHPPPLVERALDGVDHLLDPAPSTKLPWVSARSSTISSMKSLIRLA